MFVIISVTIIKIICWLFFSWNKNKMNFKKENFLVHMSAQS